MSRFSSLEEKSWFCDVLSMVIWLNHLRPDRRILSESCQSYLPSVVISGNTSPSLFCFSDDQRDGSPDTGMSARRGARTGLILINHHGYHSKHIMCPPHWLKLRILCTILAISKLWSLNHALVGYLFNSLILNCASNYSTPDVSIWNLEAPLWYWFWLLLLLWNFPSNWNEMTPNAKKKWLKKQKYTKPKWNNQTILWLKNESKREVRRV